MRTSRATLSLVSQLLIKQENQVSLIVALCMRLQKVIYVACLYIHRVSFLHVCVCVCVCERVLFLKRLIYIIRNRLGYRLGFRFLSCTEIRIRDPSPSPSLCNVKCFALYNVAIGFGIRIQVCTRVRLRQCKWTIRSHRSQIRLNPTQRI